MILSSFGRLIFLLQLEGYYLLLLDKVYLQTMPVLMYKQALPVFKYFL